MIFKGHDFKGHNGLDDLPTKAILYNPFCSRYYIQMWVTVARLHTTTILLYLKKVTMQQC